MIQQQVVIHHSSEVTANTNQILAEDPVLSDMIRDEGIQTAPTALRGVVEVGFDDPEVGLERYELESRNLTTQTHRTARLHRMARRSRWVGWKHFSNREEMQRNPKDSHLIKDRGVNFFQSAPVSEWVILIVVCFLLCLLDGVVLRRAPDTFYWHLAVIGIWMAVAGLYLWGVWARMGKHRGVEWISGYVLEWMLSLDNLFIFHLVFQTYKTPQDQRKKAVFVGIIGAVIMRMVFFLVVSTLLHAFGWFRWPFGTMLVWSGIEAVRGEGDDDTDVKDTRLVRALRWCFGTRILEGYDEDGTAIFVWDKKTGKLQLSLLFVVIFIVEFSDIVFALDSVSAKVAQIPNQYIAFSSSVMAMYGLRAMFFIVQDLVEMFDLLKYGLGVILVFIGVELMFGHWIHISSGLECVLIVGTFVLCIIASHVKSRFWPGDDAVEDAAEEAAEETLGPQGSRSKEAKCEPAGPLDNLTNRPEGEEVESGSAEAKRAAWTIHEGRKRHEEGDDKEGSRRRSRSESALKGPA